ncbi:MAG: alpha/beta hydrolase [Actinobacteria bacterium]|nr:alpha/beta hydrolase [Actinomycetota bacterium]MCG2803649.1 alpha/beta hydrolase [Cellulomonas sp.]
MSLHTLRPSVDGHPPLLLLHAFPLDHRMWAAAAEAIPAPRGLLAADLPDRDEPLPSVPSLEAAADALAEELARAGVARVVVAGISMGGYLALALVERHPALVAGLGLVDTKSAADSHEAARRRRDTAHELLEAGTVDAVRPMVASLIGETTTVARPGLVELVAGWIDDQSPQVLAWCQGAMAARPDRTEVLAGYAGPVAVLVGDEDTLTGVEVARAMAEVAADAQLVVLPGVGHLSAVEDPGAVGLALAELAVRAD